MEGLYPSPSEFTTLLREHLSSAGNSERAHQMAAYMKHHFAFFGIRQAHRRSLFKDFLKGSGIPSVQAYPDYCRHLFQQAEREFHYCAIELAATYIKQETKVDLYVEMIQTKSWWDSVDSINSMLIMPYFKQKPENLDLLTLEWAKHDDVWLKRTSIISQLKMRSSTQSDILFRNIRHNLSSKEFFVQKAIGWALRELSKTESKLIEGFVKSEKLAKLSEREAMRIILKSRL